KAGRGDEDALGLGVEGRRHRFARPSRLEQRRDSAETRHGFEALDERTGPDHDEYPGANQEDDDKPYDRVQHFSLGYAWKASVLQPFTRGLRLGSHRSNHMHLLGDRGRNRYR